MEIIVKVFVTVELEDEKILPDVISRSTYKILMDSIDLLRKEGVPVQYKETNLPRFRPNYLRASELDNIERK